MHQHLMYDLSDMGFLKGLFLDDTSIHSSNSYLKKLSESLQESVNSLLDFNRMSLNPDKTKFMLITTRQNF